jgi:hypothetical protein
MKRLAYPHLALEKNILCQRVTTDISQGSGQDGFSSDSLTSRSD